MALCHHLHEARQQACSLAESGNSVIQQQPDQPNPLHLYQQAGEEGHHKDVHLPGPGPGIIPVLHYQ